MATAFKGGGHLLERWRAKVVATTLKGGRQRWYPPPLQVVATTFAQHLPPLKVVAEGGGHYLCLKGGGGRWCRSTLKVVAPGGGHHLKRWWAPPGGHPGRWKGIIHHFHGGMEGISLSFALRSGRESSTLFIERCKVLPYITCIERWKEIIHHFHSEVEGVLLSGDSLPPLNANDRGTPSASP